MPGLGEPGGIAHDPVGCGWADPVDELLDSEGIADEVSAEQRLAAIERLGERQGAKLASVGSPLQALVVEIEFT
jgi:hypothetical protein